MANLRIAVIGSGMAGLTIAYLCKKAGHDVTLFEAQPQRGMDAHALTIPPDNINKIANFDNAQAGGVLDVPLRVMSQSGWKSVLALCDHLGVNTFAVDTPIALSWLDRKTWFRSAQWRIGPLSLPTVSQFKYLNKSGWIIVKNLWRLYWEPLSDQQSHETNHETIEQFFIRRRYDDTFWQGFLLPLLGTITTCRREFLLNYPAISLLQIVVDIIFGPPLRRLKGGTKAVVDALTKDLKMVSGSPITQLQSEGNHLNLTNSHGERFQADKVIFATQANQLDFLRKEFAAECHLLDQFVFDAGELVVHRDHSVMPQNRRDWTPLSYLMDASFKTSMFSVWTNPIEPTLASSEPIFQTWNPVLPIRDDLVIQKLPLQRAVVTARSKADLKVLTDMHLTPGRKVFFCGSWSSPGVPLLESAVRSALDIALILGIKTPWLLSP